MASRAVSVSALFAVSWMLWRGVREYGELLDLERESIPPDRFRSMESWKTVSHGMIASIICPAGFTAAFFVKTESGHR